MVARTRRTREQEAVGRTVPGDRERRAQVEHCIVEVRRLWAKPGFLTPDPPPPIVVGAFGPKMAELAGRVADGINVPATRPDPLVDVARAAHAAAGRDPGRFLVTVFGGFDERWLRPDSRERARLVALGVDRLILLDGPPYDVKRITAAAPLLRASAAF